MRGFWSGWYDFWRPGEDFGVVTGHRDITEEEKKQYKKILMSFIDGSRLDNKDK